MQKRRRAQTAQGPNGAKSQTARNPNGAKSQTARNPKRREIPNNAKSRTARNPRRRQTANRPKANSRGSSSRRLPFRLLSLFGISRCLGFGVVRDFAPFGISRRLG